MAKSLGIALPVMPNLDQAAVKQITAKIDDMSRSRSIDMRINGARLDADLKKYQAELGKLTGDKNVTIKAKLDSAAAKLELDKLTAEKRSIDITAKINSSGLAGIDKEFSNAGGGAANSFNKGLKGGGESGGGAGFMSPEILGPLAVAGLSILPAVMGAAATLGVAAMGTYFAVKGSKQLQQQGKNLLSGLQDTLEKSASGLVKPIHDALSEVGSQLPTIGKLFSQAFGAAAPVIKPVTSGLLTLVKNILPPLTSLIKSAVGPTGQLFQYFGKITATDLGGFFKNLQPGMKASFGILEDILGSVTGLLPPIGKLASVLAVALKPVFDALSKTMRSSSSEFSTLLNACVPLAVAFAKLVTALAPLLPPLTELATAILTHLVIPALTGFANALTGVSTVVGKVVTAVTSNMGNFKLVFLEALRDVISGMTDFAGTILHLASDALGWLPGVGPKLKTASADFDSWRASVNNSLDQVIAKTQDQIASGKAQAALSAEVAKSWDALSSHIRSASAQQHLTQAQTDALTTAMKTNKGNIDLSKSAFDAFTSSMHLSTSQANALWQQLHQVSGKYAADVVIAVTGGGAVKVTEQIAATLGAIDQGKTPTAGQVTAATQRQTAGVGPSAVLGAATGAHIVRGMGPAGRDSVPIMAAPGEAIVPVQHVPKVMGLLKDKGVPGFASGGLIGASSSFSQAGSVGSSLGKVAEPAFTKALGSSVGSAAAKSLSAAMKSELSAAASAQQAALSEGSTAGITSGSAMANGKAIYAYLVQSGFSKIAAAGAIAGMYGESGWNPESHEPASAGDGPNNGGLIGFTPLYDYMGTISGSRSNVPDSVVTGNATSDFQRQLKGILEYIKAFNMEGVISRMNSASNILDAANMWGTGVEKYGINDVHSAGLALAAQIMGADPQALKPKGGVSTSPVSGEQTFSGYSYASGGIVGKIQSKLAQIDAMKNTIASLSGIKKPSRSQQLSLKNDRVKLGLYEKELGADQGVSAANAEATAKAKIAAENAAADQARIMHYGTAFSHSALGADIGRMKAKMGLDAKRGNYRDYAAVAANLADAQTAYSKWPSQDNAKHDSEVAQRNAAAANAAKFLKAGNLRSYMVWNQKAIGDDAKITGLDAAIATQGTLAAGGTPLATMSNKLFSSGVLAKLGSQFKNHSLDPSAIGNLSKAQMLSLAMNVPGTVLDAIYSDSPAGLASALMGQVSAPTGFGDIGTTLALLGRISGVHGLVGGKKFSNGGVINEPVNGIGLRSGMPYSFAEHGPERVSKGAGTPSNGNLEGLLVQAVNALHEVRRAVVATGSQANKNLGGVSRLMNI